MSTRCPKCGAVVEDGWPTCRQCFEPIKRPGFLSRLIRALGGKAAASDISAPGSGSPAIRMVTRKTETIKVRDARTGEMREYHSLEEVPEEYREKVRQAEEAALAGKGGAKITFRDTSGIVHHYNSVDELPPEIRAIYEKTRSEKS